MLARRCLKASGRTLRAHGRGIAPKGARMASSDAAGASRLNGAVAAALTGGIFMGAYVSRLSPLPRILIPNYTSQIGQAYLQPISLDNQPTKKAPKATKDAPKYISFEEVQKHNTRESCWVIIDGQVYDATSVLQWHPAGPEPILKQAGSDATYVSRITARLASSPRGSVARCSSPSIRRIFSHICPPRPIWALWTPRHFPKKSIKRPRRKNASRKHALSSHRRPRLLICMTLRWERHQDDRTYVTIVFVGVCREGSDVDGMGVLPLDGRR